MVFHEEETTDVDEDLPALSADGLPQTDYSAEVRNRGFSAQHLSHKS